MRTHWYTTLSVCALLFLSGPTLSAELERKHLGDWEKDLGYTQTVKVGNTLYLSGITSGASSMSAQIEEIYRLIRTILLQYGVGPNDVIKETIYTTDIDSLKQHASVRKTFYSSDVYPAATWVQVDRLIVPEVLLEVEVMVNLP